MGGSSSSSKKQVTNNTNIVNNELSDHNAVDKSFGFGDRALDTVDRSVDKSLGFAKDISNNANQAVQNVFGFAGSALESVEQSSKLLADNINNDAAETRETFAAVRLGLIVLGLVGTIFFIFGRKKK